MIKLVDLLKEVQLSSNEQAVIDDILSLDEAIDFSNVMDKVKSYVKKGLITATILASLLNNSAFSQEQKDQIKDAVKTEKQVDNDVISFEDFKVRVATILSLPSLYKLIVIVAALVGFR